MSVTSTLSIVLVSPKEPGNIGASARAMLNMGVSDLRLVAPRCDPHDDMAMRMAVHAREVVRGARVYESLEAALADRDYAIGTTARERADLEPPRYPRELRPRVRSAHAPAVVFGPEESGLSNDDLMRCQATLRIPTGPYASLNLAQAVLLTTYELTQADREVEAGTVPNRASREELEGFYTHLETFMREVGYTDEARTPHMLRLYRKIFDRADLSSDEVRMLRGLWAQGLWAARRTQS